MKLGFRKQCIIIEILLLTIWVTAIHAEPDSADTSVVEEDVELHIDFSSGAVFANEAPKVISPIDHHAIALGISDTVVAKLTEVFYDAENGTALSFNVVSLDSSQIEVTINPVDSSLQLTTPPTLVQGRSSVIITASDGRKEVSDTFTVVVKELFALRDTIADTTVKSGTTSTIMEYNISTIVPLVDSNSTERFTCSASSSDKSIITVSTNADSNSVVLEVVDSGFGTAAIELIIRDSDGFSVTESFLVTVKRDFGTTEYTREQVVFNPGISVFTGIGYSGMGATVWINDLFGGAVNGYYYWDQNGIGVELALMGKPHLDFLLQPYGMVSVGYHRQVVEKTFEGFDLTINKDIPLFVLRVAGGASVWLGDSKRHVIAIEAGYTYGQNEYSSLSITDIGSPDYSFTTETFKMPPLYLRLYYTFYFRKL